MPFIDKTQRCRNCGKRPHPRPQQHHVVYRQIVRRTHGDELDPDNALALCGKCHVAHHDRRRVLSTLVLRDENIAYAFRQLGQGPAINYFARYYVDSDVDRRVQFFAENAA